MQNGIRNNKARVHWVLQEGIPKSKHSKEVECQLYSTPTQRYHWIRWDDRAKVHFSLQLKEEYASLSW